VTNEREGERERGRERDSWIHSDVCPHTTSRIGKVNSIDEHGVKTLTTTRGDDSDGG
jgi:hypothetical protein